jgi:hypothetical protein
MKELGRGSSDCLEAPRWRLINKRAWSGTTAAGARWSSQNPGATDDLHRPQRPNAAHQPRCRSRRRMERRQHCRRSYRARDYRGSNRVCDEQRRLRHDCRNERSQRHAVSTDHGGARQLWSRREHTKRHPSAKLHGCGRRSACWNAEVESDTPHLPYCELAVCRDFPSARSSRASPARSFADLGSQITRSALPQISWRRRI